MIENLLNTLEQQGFYTGSILRPELGSVTAAHDTCDHLVHPVGLCPYKGMIPPTNEGETWASVNSLAKIYLAKEFSREEFFQKLEYTQKRCRTQFNKEVMYDFFIECVEYWETPYQWKQELLQEYWKALNIK